MKGKTRLLHSPLRFFFWTFKSEACSYWQNLLVRRALELPLFTCLNKNIRKKDEQNIKKILNPT